MSSDRFLTFKPLNFTIFIQTSTKIVSFVNWQSVIGKCGRVSKTDLIVP
ncbi:hypothetical protein MCR_1841 [Moraxella catarrhalis BBH18]|nr:hypothetical protein MCR_1841 [Moraxella catarrhalis BBH18]RUO14007.1 hypothetical protein EJK49_1125 [Moraxella catarrhalis]